MANVTIIPARRQVGNNVKQAEQPKLRVAAYCRVSTDSDEQETSYETQVSHYTEYIKSHPEWELAGIFADDGISGTNTKKRDEFNRMIDECMAGNIDMVITKSISRFARNTLDCLKYIRLLKDKNIAVWFEKENIWTFDGKGELLITIMSSLAQEESRSISENCTWGQRKRFADGKVTVPFKRFLGYDRGPNGELVVNEEQAKLVKRIYRMFMEGTTPYGIATKLTEENIKLPVSLFGKGSFYLLRAKGDSMIEVGVEEDDLVLIRQQSRADPGQIVVALVGEEATLKRYYPEPEKYRVRLHPENRKMNDIYVSNCVIQGVAVKVLKDLI